MPLVDLGGRPFLCRAPSLLKRVHWRATGCEWAATVGSTMSTLTAERPTLQLEKKQYVNMLFQLFVGKVQVLLNTPFPEQRSQTLQQQRVYLSDTAPAKPFYKESGHSEKCQSIK